MLFQDDRGRQRGFHTVGCSSDVHHASETSEGRTMRSRRSVIVREGRSGSAGPESGLRNRSNQSPLPVSVKRSSPHSAWKYTSRILLRVVMDIHCVRPCITGPRYPGWHVRIQLRRVEGELLSRQDLIQKDVAVLCGTAYQRWRLTTRFTGCRPSGCCKVGLRSPARGIQVHVEGTSADYPRCSAAINASETTRAFL